MSTKINTKKKDTDPENPIDPIPETPKVPESQEMPPVDLVPATPEAPEIPTPEAPKAPEGPTETGKERKTKKSYPDYLQAYVDKYPTNKTFHVTADRMVFLAPDKNLAVLHQSGIKGAGTVETYNI